MKLANVMRNLYQNTHTDTTGIAMIDLNPEIDTELITNNQNQTRISFLTVLWSSILDNTMWKNSSYIIHYILEFILLFLT